MPFPPTDGGTIATMNMIMGLAAAGNNVEVLAMQTPKHNFSADKIEQTHRQNIKWHTIWVDTSIRMTAMLRNLLLSGLPYNAERFISHDFNNKLIEILGDKHFDVVQLEGLYLTSYIPTIRKNSDAAISLRAHNVEWIIWDRLAQTERNPLLRFYKRQLSNRIKKLEAETFKNIDILVPISRNDALQLPFSKPDSTFVSPTGIETDRFLAENKAKDQKTFFYIGALDWEPNQEALLWFINNVWIDIHRATPDWTFHIAGRNAPRKFADKIRQCPVVFDGQVPSAQQYINSHNIMIVPLLSGSGMRIKIIEAMAQSHCVITTPTGAEGIDAENGRHLLIGATANELKNLITSIINNPQKADKIAAEAYNFCKSNFSNQAIVNNLNDSYRQWLAHSK